MDFPCGLLRNLDVAGATGHRRPVEFSQNRDILSERPVVIAWWQREPQAKSRRVPFSCLLLLGIQKEWQKIYINNESNKSYFAVIKKGHICDLFYFFLNSIYKNDYKLLILTFRNLIVPAPYCKEIGPLLKLSSRPSAVLTPFK